MATHGRYMYSKDWIQWIAFEAESVESLPPGKKKHPTEKDPGPLTPNPAYLHTTRYVPFSMVVCLKWTLDFEPERKALNLQKLQKNR